jgi:hypothetical protein
MTHTADDKTDPVFETLSLSDSSETTNSHSTNNTNQHKIHTTERAAYSMGRRAAPTSKLIIITKTYFKSIIDKMLSAVDSLKKVLPVWANMQRINTECIYILMIF